MTDVAQSIPGLPPGMGRIYLYRESRFGGQGDGIQPAVMVNGKKVAAILAGGFIFIDRLPGQISVHLDTSGDRRVSFALEENQTRYIRTDFCVQLIGTCIEPKLVDSETGAREILKTRYSGRAAIKE